MKRLIYLKNEQSLDLLVSLLKNDRPWKKSSPIYTLIVQSMSKLRIHFQLVLIVNWFISLHTCWCLACILRCSLIWIRHSLQAIIASTHTHVHVQIVALGGMSHNLRSVYQFCFQMRLWLMSLTISTFHIQLFYEMGVHILLFYQVGDHFSLFFIQIKRLFPVLHSDCSIYVEA
jgi:hypothetical protein